MKCSGVPCGAKLCAVSNNVQFDDLQYEIQNAIDCVKFTVRTMKCSVKCEVHHDQK